MYLVIMVGVEPDLIDVERFGAVDVRHRDRDEFNLPVHARTVFEASDSVCRQAGSRRGGEIETNAGESAVAERRLAQLYWSRSSNRHNWSGHEAAAARILSRWLRPAVRQPAISVICG